ncbi:hypothetical protein CYY_001192 [Polysphondylium violaceum]|uniref:Uncharacterized protein n=1 Tax=Polysphondylium violaceum TaxID=133409 RepID=A0A8J4PYJ7_9MYCE|nr:hypothetical protein CYY_001192 [Polysphondylium violaceum]
MNNNLIIQKIIRYSIRHYYRSPFVCYSDFHYTLCKLMLISKTWLQNILPKIKYPLLLVKTKEEWDKVVGVIVNHKLPLRLSFSVDNGLQNYLKSGMGINQLLDIIGANIDTLSSGNLVENDVLDHYFRRQEAIKENNRHDGEGKVHGASHQYNLQKYKGSFSLCLQTFFNLSQLYRDNITDMELFEIIEEDKYQTLIGDMKNLRHLVLNDNNYGNKLVPFVQYIANHNSNLETVLLKVTFYKTPIQISIPTRLVLSHKVSVKEFKTILDKSGSLVFFQGQVYADEDSDSVSQTTITSTSLQSLYLTTGFSKWGFSDVFSLDLPNLSLFKLRTFEFLFPVLPKLRDFTTQFRVKSLETYFANNNNSATDQLLVPKKLTLQKIVNQPIQKPHVLTDSLLTNLNNLLIHRHVNQLSFHYFSMQETTSLLSLLSEKKQVDVLEILDSNSDFYYSYNISEFNAMLDALVSNTQLTKLFVSIHDFTNIQGNTLLLFKVLESLSLSIFNLDDLVSLKSDQEVHRYKSLVQKNIKNLLHLYLKFDSSSKLYYYDNVSFLNSNNILHYKINF